MGSIGRDIDRAVQLLEQAKVIGVPTETVYGLAGNALNTAAVSEIFRVKNRPSFDPLIVHVSGIDQVGNYTHQVEDPVMELMERFAPGPLTVILPKRNNIPDLVTSGLPDVGIRVPRHPLFRELLGKLDFPLAAPSANPFGYISPTSARHVHDQLGDKIPYILDGGDSKIGIESTVVQWREDALHILRAGAITAEMMRELDIPIVEHAQSSSNPVSPGMLDKHYAPRIPMTFASLDDLLQSHQADRIGLLAWKDTRPDLPSENQYILSPNGNLQEAAQNLFAFLRKLDQSNIDIISCEKVPNHSIGRAINDKLHRAVSS